MPVVGGTGLQPNQVRPISPFSLPNFQLILDARSIAQPDGSNVATWQNTAVGGSAGDAVKSAFTGFPILRSAGSAGGRPVVDFNGVKQMNGTLPVVAMDVSKGFTCYAYIMQDVVDPNDGGGFNAQSIGGSDIAGGFRQYAVIYPAANTPDVGFNVGVGDKGALPPAVVGRHISTLVIQPPGVNGSTTIFYDDITGVTDVAAGFSPNTTYLVSGNAAQNITLKGKLAFFAWANEAHSILTRLGVELWLLETFG